MARSRTAPAAPPAVAVALVAAVLAALPAPALAQPFCDPFGSTRYEWQLVGTGTGIARNDSNRYRTKLAHFKGQLLMIGGLATARATGPDDYADPAAWLTDVWASTDAGASWSRKATTAFSRRLLFEVMNTPMSAATQQLYVAGGVVSMGPPVPTAEVLVSSDAARWSVADWRLPSPMYQFSLAFSLADSRIYVANVEGGDLKVQSISWNNRNTGAWTVASSALGPRYKPTLFAGDNALSTVALYGGSLVTPTPLPSGAPTTTASASPQPVVADVSVSVDQGASWQRRAYLGPVPGTSVDSGFGSILGTDGMYLFTVRRDKVSMFCSDNLGYFWAENPVVNVGAGLPTTYYDS